MQDGSNNNYGDLPPPYKESSPGGSEGGGGGGGGDRMTNMPQPLPYLPHLAPTMPLDVKENIFRDIIMKYEIREEFANRLKSLSNFKTVFILDDSSSMNNILQDSPLNVNGSFKATRWDELQYFTNISLEIVNLFNENNCTDVYFLNKPPVKNIYNVQEFMGQFRQMRPNGFTPLSRAFNQVLFDNSHLVRERKLLCIILTDGEPTDNTGNSDIKGFKSSLMYRSPISRIFVSIVACTDDDESVSYLNDWDRKIKNLDVVDDFRNERKEILKAQGARFRFSYGDYVVKTLLGSFDREMDLLDEKNTSCNLI